MSDDLQRLEAKLDAHFADLQEHREDVVQRLTRMETTMTGDAATLKEHAGRITSLETGRTYANGIFGTLSFLWATALVYLKYYGAK